jgi:uncharacterized protein (TIGR00369 family)
MKKTFNILNTDYVKDIQEKLQRQFFMHLVGFKLTEISAGKVCGELVLEEKHLQQNYFVHGGVMATAADVVMGFAAYSLAPKGHGVVTVDLNISFLNPGIGTKLIAEGRVVKPGKSIFFCEADLWVEKDGVLIHTNRAVSTMHRISL